MHHEGGRSDHLDSAGMRSASPKRPGRGLLAALFTCLALTPFLLGCGEDRSNLIPPETAESLLQKLNEVDRLVAEGQCFEAKEVAASAQNEVEQLDADVDPELKRSLADGVTQLQVYVGDPEKCTEAETVIEEAPEETDQDETGTEGTTGETGTTDSETDTDQDTTTEDDDREQTRPETRQPPNRPPTPAPAPTPPPVTPTNPTTPTPPSGPGSGGLGPG